MTLRKIRGASKQVEYKILGFADWAGIPRFSQCFAEVPLTVAFLSANSEAEEAALLSRTVPNRKSQCTSLGALATSLKRLAT